MSDVDEDAQGKPESGRIAHGYSVAAITLAIVLGLSLLSAAGVMLYLINKDYNDYKGLIQEAVLQSTGRALTMDGDIEIALSLNPSLVVSGVHLSNPAWAGQERMMAIERLETELRLLPLLQGRLEVNHLIVEGVKISLETDKDGRGNWLLPPQAEQPQPVIEKSAQEKPDAAVLPQFHDIRFRDLQLSFRDGQQQRAWQLALPELRVTAQGEAMELSAKARIADEAVALQGRVSSLQALMENRAVSVDLEAVLRDARLQLRGRLEQPLTGRGMKLQLQLDSEHPVRLAAIAGLGLTQDKPLQLEADVQDSEEGLTLRVEALFAGETVTVAGWLSSLPALLENRTVTTELEAQLAGTRLQLKGSLEQPLAGRGAKLQLLLDSEHPARVAALIGISLAEELPLHLDAELNGGLEGVFLRARAVIADETVMVEGRLNSTQALLKNGAVNIDLKAALSDLKLQIKGDVQQPLDAVGLKLNVMLASRDPTRLAAEAGVQWPKEMPLEMNVDLAGDLSRQLLLHLNHVSLGPSDAAGEIALRWEGAEVAVHAELQSKVLDLRGWLAAESAAEMPADKQHKRSGPAERQSGRLFSAAPLSTDGLERLPDIRLVLYADEFLTPKFDLQKSALDLQLAKGLVTVSAFRALIAEGSVTANATIQAANRAVSIDSHLAAKGVVAERLLRIAGAGEGLVQGGPLDADVTLAASGESVAALIAALQGRIKVSMGKAKIKTNALNTFGGDLVMSLLDKLNPFADKPDYSELECGVVHFRASNGRLLSEDGIAFETGRMNILSEGVIDLKDETLDLGIITEARDGLGLNISNMINVVRLVGPLTEPALTMDAAKTGMAAARVAGAIATGGISILGESLLNRVTASNICATALTME